MHWRQKPPVRLRLMMATLTYNRHSVQSICQRGMVFRDYRHFPCHVYTESSFCAFYSSTWQYLHVSLNITILRCFFARMRRMRNLTTVYEAPLASVVEIKTEGLICSSPNMTIFLTDPYPTEVNFGRDSYGSATTDTWD